VTAVTALPPGPRMPRLPMTIGWFFRPLPLLERWRREFGDTFTMRIAGENTWVVLSDPEDVRTVFQGDPRLLHAGAANRILRPVLGDQSILLLDEREHMIQRKLLLPPFHGERMQRHEETMRRVAADEIASWPRGEPFALHPRMQRLTLEVIMRVVFGVEEADRLARLRTALTRFVDFSAATRTFAAFAVLGPERIRRARFFRRALDPLDALMLDEIARRRRAPALDERDDVLSMLVQARHEDGTAMGDAELRDELMTLLVAGHETTATALAWALERLVRHPEMLDRLRSGDEAYTDAVLQETLRRRPVLPLVLRRLAEPMELGGRLLPAGISVSPSIHLVHHRADVYPDPYAFRPERFLDTPPGTYTWIPFGGGVRRCLGASFALLEMKTVLRAVLDTVALRPTDPAPERVTRRAITWTPSRGASVIAD
jgi:cytochrome P450